MKVLFISKYARTGGAAIAAYRLMQDMQRQSADVSMLVQDDTGDREPGVHSTTGTVFKKLINLYRFVLERVWFTLHEASRSVRFLFSMGSTGESISRHPLVKEADILHLHWINGGFLSLKSLKELFDTGKPVVWTFHDMWAFTGGCHYALECTGYMKECGRCPYLKKGHSGDLSHRILKKKEKIFRKDSFVVVTSSKWLSGCARSSSLLKDFEIHAIPIPVDLETFRPAGKEKAREKLGLDTARKYILFGAANIRNMLKGLDYFIEAIRILHDEMAGDRSVEVILFGKSDDDLSGMIPFRTHYIPYTGSLETIVDIYNAAQVFVIPSLQDNLPNTIIESLSCGTPVVGFRSGGIPEMVEHESNGYLAGYKSSPDLAKGMKWVLECEGYDRLCENAREKAEQDYSFRSSSAKYIELYNKLLNDR